MTYYSRKIISGPTVNNSGYEIVYVEEEVTGLKYTTPYHRFIWEEANQKKIPIGCVIHHKDGNKRNNKVENLQVMTRSAHSKHHDKLRKRKKMLARRRKLRRNSRRKRNVSGRE